MRQVDRPLVEDQLPPSRATVSGAIDPHRPPAAPPSVLPPKDAVLTARAAREKAAAYTLQARPIEQSALLIVVQG